MLPRKLVFLVVLSVLQTWAFAGEPPRPGTSPRRQSFGLQHASGISAVGVNDSRMDTQWSTAQGRPPASGCNWIGTRRRDLRRRLLCHGPLDADHRRASQSRRHVGFRGQKRLGRREDAGQRDRGVQAGAHEVCAVRFRRRRAYYEVEVYNDAAMMARAAAEYHQGDHLRGGRSARPPDGHGFAGQTAAWPSAMPR